LFGTALPAESLVPCRVPPNLLRQLAARSSKGSPRAINEILQRVEQRGNPRRW
jgi:hypothetical protein